MVSGYPQTPELNVNVPVPLHGLNTSTASMCIFESTLVLEEVCICACSNLRACLWRESRFSWYTKLVYIKVVDLNLPTIQCNGVVLLSHNIFGEVGRPEARHGRS
jgi:hypothetical protein